MARACLTGSVIIAAGTVLAAVFAVLGVLPLIALSQMRIVVGIEVVLGIFQCARSWSPRSSIW